MKTIYEPEIMMPESISGDEKINALVSAINEQLKLLSNDAKLAMHLPRLDDLSGVLLDLLAWQFHVDFYDAINLSDEQKRALIRESIATHRRKGTIWATEHVAKQFYDSPQIEEIGDYRFRIRTRGYSAQPETFPTFVKMLYDAKNVRSWLDEIIEDLSDLEPRRLYAGGAMAIGAQMTISPAFDKIHDHKVKVYAGGAVHIDANQTIRPTQPKSQKVIVHAGGAMSISALITIDSKDEPQLTWIKENPTADRLIADMGIVRDLFEIPEFAEYDLVKLFFGFQFSKHRRYRGLALENSKPTLTREEIKDVIQYAIDHKLIKNEAGEIADHILGAALKKKTEEIIIGYPHIKAKTLAEDETAAQVLDELRAEWT